MTVLISILAALLLLGPLITVHEYGHFLFARLFKVKVIRFSIGFGRPIVKWVSRRSGTEFAIGAFPLGGYVKLLDRRETEIPAGEESQDFMAKPAWQRILIVAAGPLFNFLFAALIYFIILMPGEIHWKPVVGDIFPDSFAEQAGFHAYDELLYINGEEVTDWLAANQALLMQAMEKRVASIQLKTSKGETKTLKLDLSAIDITKEEGRYLLALGIRPVAVAPVRVDSVVPEMPAAKAGIQPGDVVLAINNEPVFSFGEIGEKIQKQIDKSSPDETVSPVMVTVLRDLFLYYFPLTPVMTSVGTEGKKVAQIGVIHDAGSYYNETEQYRFAVRYSPLGIVGAATQRTVDTTQLILRSFWSIVSGQASIKNISGPVRIADIARVQIKHGWVSFLHLMAFVSISLGIVNFLPIPVLDGGHILFYLIEMIKGSPVSEKSFSRAQMVGLVLLALLMFTAFYNDFSWLANKFGPTLDFSWFKRIFSK